MIESIKKIQDMRDQQLTRGLRAVAVLGFFGVLSSLSRITTVGWRNIMFVHIFLYLLILTIVFLGRRVSYIWKAFIITGICFFLGVCALVVWGLASAGLLSFFSFCILSTLLFGGRVGLFSVITSMAAIGIIGFCYNSGVLVLNYDPEVYPVAATTWGTAVAAIALCSGVVVVALGTLDKQIVNLVQTLDKQNRELVEANRLLKKEIVERNRSESERTKLEVKLQLAKKMEALGTLAGGVAHDLNNILGSVVGYPDLLLMQLPPDSSLISPLETIKKTGIKAAAIVNDLLTLARRGVASEEIVNLNSVIEDYIASPECDRLKIYHPEVKLETKLLPGLPNVKGSPFHLSKIVMNLVSNAVEAMPSGGKVSISSEKWNVARHLGVYEEIPEGEYAIMVVADSGIGISHNDYHKIFEPFYTKKTMGRSGTGLGMAVVRGAVKDHNGYIDIESIRGEGTKFTLYFPVTMEPLPEQKPLSAIMEFIGRGESILIVDDVPEQREIASTILQTLGYSVRTTSSGEEALEHLRKNSADLLILDMFMEPGIDGLQTYAKVLEIWPRQKAIIASGDFEGELLARAKDLGIRKYVKKPYFLDEIGMAVRAELDRNAC